MHMKKADSIWHSSIWHLPALVLLSLVTRLIFRSSVLYNWDSVNFALGILDFDVIKHRPHPRGFILYISSGKVLTQFTGEPNESLVWLSIIAGTLAIVFTYALARHRFGPRDALISALLLLSSPLFWFYNEVALTYAVEAFFAVAIAYSCYRALDGSTQWIYAGALLVGLAGGFRQTTLLIMGPLILYTVIFLPWRHRLSMGALIIVICLAWGVPLIASTGGLRTYTLTNLRLASIADPKPAINTVVALAYGLHLAILLLLGYVIGLLSVKDEERRRWERPFMLFWIVPGLLICLFLRMGQPGYVLFALPAVFLLAPSLVRSGLKRLEGLLPKTAPPSRNSFSRRYIMTIVAMLAVGTISFLLGTSKFIATQEARWKPAQTLAGQYAPSQTVVLSDLSWDSGFRLASYYMRDYHVYGFAIQEAKGPFKVSDPLIVPGWIFHSYQLEDNYDLAPEQHQFNKILDLPPGTRGLIVTHPALVPHTSGATAGTLDESPVSALSDRLLYVALPESVSQIAVVEGRLELR
jgi:hypothetical protein